MILSDGKEMYLDWTPDPHHEGMIQGVLLIYTPHCKEYCKVFLNDKELDLLAERICELRNKVSVNNELE